MKQLGFSLLNPTPASGEPVPAVDLQREGASPQSGVWWCTGLPNRDGAMRYVHLIRSPDDPQPLTRKERHELPGYHATLWQDLDTQCPVAWAEAIVALLEDGHPRTFNAIMLELTAHMHPASSAFESNADLGLWVAVDDGRLQWSSEGPPRFRVAERGGIS